MMRALKSPDDWTAPALLSLVVPRFLRRTPDVRAMASPEPFDRASPEQYTAGALTTSPRGDPRQSGSEDGSVWRPA
jgi:hypothetical protein